MVFKTDNAKVEQFFFSDGTPICTECGGEAIRDGRHLCGEACEQAWRDRRRLGIQRAAEAKAGTEAETSADDSANLMLWDL